MKIKNLKIGSFGKLRDVNIALDDRITVVTGKNEAGKSSIASFVKYMLYGFANSRKDELSENEKKRFMPWDGGECFGEITFESADGKSYSAVRKTASRSQNTVFDENGMPVTGENAGEFFLGISENAFRKTAFIGSSEAAFTDEGELDEAIRNMVYSADESVDSRAALKKLEALRKYYLGKTGKSGEIYEIDKELSELCLERDKWKDGHKELLASEHQLSETSAKIAFNKQQRIRLEGEMKNLEYLRAKTSLDRINSLRQAAEESKIEFEDHYKLLQNGAFVPDRKFEDALKSCLDGIERAKNEAEDNKKKEQAARSSLESIYSDTVQKKVSEALAEKNETAENLLSQINKLKKKRKTSLVLSLVLAITVVGFAVFFIRYVSFGKKLGKLAEEYGCENAAVLEEKLVQGASFKSVEESARQMFDEARRALEESQGELEKGVHYLSELALSAGFDQNEPYEYLARLRAYLEKDEQLRRKCREDFVSYDTMIKSVDVEKLSKEAECFDESIPVREEKTVRQELAFYTQAIDALLVRERELEKKAAVLSNTLPKPSEIQSRILSLSENRELLVQKHNALDMAIEALERASETMKSMAAPKIASETSSLFSSITEGKYKALYADNDMKLTFLLKDEAAVRDAGYLSTGTLDAAYISLRITLCEFLCKERPTLVFDDAFSHMDDERLCNVLSFLEKLSEKFQIVILSCHDREKKYFEGRAKIIDFAI